MCRRVTRRGGRTLRYKVFVPDTFYADSVPLSVAIADQFRLARRCPSSSETWR